MFTDQISAYLQTVNTAATQTAYRRALEQFQAWYTGSYGREPDVTQLTAEEARERRVHLTAVKQASAATVNQRLAALRGLARHCGQMLVVKGMQKVTPPLEPLSGRELGRLLAALAGDRWLDKRNVAMIGLFIDLTKFPTLKSHDNYIIQRGHSRVSLAESIKRISLEYPLL